MSQAQGFLAACTAPKGARQVVRFHQFVKAYRKDNHSYTYWQDDGRRETLIAGQDGVTEEWIAWLKAWHIEERNNLRHGKDMEISLEAFCETLDDYSEALMDVSGDPEGQAIERIEREAQRKMLYRILEQLTPRQRILLVRIRVRGESFASIAREEGVNESTLRWRLRKAMERSGLKEWGRNWANTRHRSSLCKLDVKHHSDQAETMPD
jgi:DNA-directed RNA polymerase specialized sigma24 family protein